QALNALALRPQRITGSGWTGLAIDASRLMLTDGRCADQIAATSRSTDVAVFDRPMHWPPSTDSVLAYTVASGTSDPWRAQAPAWWAQLGFVPQIVADSPGLVVARTIAMLINEAADAVLQGVCTAEGADLAMRLGVNYPAGPFEWLAGWGVK